ncbi:unnamed protein product [Chironomus riparius]|uniref:F-box domain-containing protein n=1 Tax=Chironomus riparius TaxID=315576 RepID=A0A9N9S7C4_9DIPT|nr:unnamed protein product [Chironomus riparius]
MQMKKIKLEIHQNHRKLSINSLPNDVLIEIFQYFDENSLRSALNVCQSWSEIIKSSLSLSKDLTIKVQESVKNDKNLSIHIPIDGLKYRKLHVKGPIINNSNYFELTDLLHKYGHNFQHLILEDFTCDKKLFEKCQNVSKLRVLSNCNEEFVSSFENLTELILNIGSLSTINNFKQQTVQLKTFKLKLKQTTDLNEKECQILYNFVLSQNKFLKELSIAGVPIDSQFIKEIFTFEKLTKIELEIDKVEANQSIIKDQHWRTLKFKNPNLSYKSFILNAASSFSSK